MKVVKCENCGKLKAQPKKLIRQGRYLELNPKRKQPKEEQGYFILGGILAILGLVAIVEGQIIGGFFLLGLGVVFMASSNKEFRKQFFDFIFSIFKGLWKLLSRSS